MVYRGKLSRACVECRAKKTRCDAARPTCGQCTRTGRQCSGYQDVDSLRVLDQTNAVTFKQRPKVQKLDTVPAHLHDWTRTATVVFFYEYANGSPGYIKTDFDSVGSLLVKSKTDSMLSDIVTSLGMLALAKTSNDASISLKAAQKYSSALRKGSVAVGDLALARADEVVTAVWLLSLYQAMGDDISNDQERSLHSHGGLQLATHRGKEQFTTHAGRSAFTYISCGIVMDCLRDRKRAPREITDLVEMGRHMHHAEAQSHLRLVDYACELCDILADNLSNSYEPNTLEARFKYLVAMDDNMSLWPSTLSDKFDTQRFPGKDALGLDGYDVYTCHVPARTLNMYRLVRIRLNEEISYYASLLEPLCPEIRTALRTIQFKAEATMNHLSEDICYSVPFFMNPENPAEAKRTITMYGGISVLRPLISIVETNQLLPGRLPWVVEQINRISAATGLGRPWIVSRVAGFLSPGSTPSSDSCLDLKSSTSTMTPEADILASTELCAL